MASSAAILAAIRADADDPQLTWDDALRRAHQGDAERSPPSGAGTATGRAMATVVNPVGPEVIQVVGEGVADFDLYEDRMREAFHDHVFGAADRVPDRHQSAQLHRLGPGRSRRTAPLGCAERWSHQIVDVVT